MLSYDPLDHRAGYPAAGACEKALTRVYLFEKKSRLHFQLFFVHLKTNKKEKLRRIPHKINFRFSFQCFSQCVFANLQVVSILY